MTTLEKKINNMKSGDKVGFACGGMSDEQRNVLYRFIKDGTLIVDPVWLVADIAPHAYYKYATGKALAPFEAFIKA